MVEFDVRDGVLPEITRLRYATTNSCRPGKRGFTLGNGGSVSVVIRGDEDAIVIHGKDDLNNLRKALDKAESLGWFEDRKG